MLLRWPDATFMRALAWNDYQSHTSICPLMTWPTYETVCSDANFYRATARNNATHGITRGFVRLSNKYIATKRKKLVPTFLHHMKDRSS